MHQQLTAGREKKLFVLKILTEICK